jgi:hypothetical protein
LVWTICLPPRGRSGGILAGINNASLIVTKVISGDYCVKFHLKIKKDNFEWVLVAVYGAAQDRQKPAFLAELLRICENEMLPLMVGGDFNIIRRKEEKNNDNFYARWPFIFNAIIESLDLLSLEDNSHGLIGAPPRPTRSLIAFLLELR